MRLCILKSVLAACALLTSALPLHAELIEPLDPFVTRVVTSLHTVPQDRRKVLDGIVRCILDGTAEDREVSLTFICTHNSRRSHLSQVWCQTAAAYYNVPGVATYSGGTEATACNVRTIAALRRAGLSVVCEAVGDNPTYLVQYSDSEPPVRAFSKVYQADGNPKSEFIAIMCCSDADRNCPVVEGAGKRFALPYEDPKAADNTPDEANRYDQRCLQIAQEMFYLMSEVSQQRQGTRDQPGK